MNSPQKEELYIETTSLLSFVHQNPAKHNTEKLPNNNTKNGNLKSETNLKNMSHL